MGISIMEGHCRIRAFWVERSVLIDRKNGQYAQRVDKRAENWKVLNNGVVITDVKMLGRGRAESKYKLIDPRAKAKQILTLLSLGSYISSC
jgi:hypothetical protein